MLHLDETFTCPSCDKEKPLSDVVICEDSEVMQAIPIEETSRYVRYWEKKRIYKFRRCKKCNRQIKAQKNLSEILRYIGIGLVVLGVFSKTGIFLIGILLIIISLLVFFLWSYITKIYPHTTYDKARECDALLPIDTP